MNRFSRGSSLLRKAVSARSFATTPHGGVLHNLVLDHGSDAWKQLKNDSLDNPEIVLSKRQMCDIELLLNGAFSPLDGFMSRDDYDSVVRTMRLKNGVLFPMPITLDVTEKQAEALGKPAKISLKDVEGNTIAVIDVADMWKPDKAVEAQMVFGGDPEHPAIDYLNKTAGNVYIGGKLTGLQLPPSYNYKTLRLTPAQTRAMFEKKGWNKVVAFQTRNPMHRAHYELTVRALASDPELKLLVHPVVGMTKPGDIDHHTRVKCYQQIMPHYPPGRADLCVFPLAMRMGGPREAIWHTIIRKNYGATDFIVGRDHAGPGSNSKGEDFYGPYEARDEAVAYGNELGMNMHSYEMMVYAADDDTYYPINEVPTGKDVKKLSGTEVRKRLAEGTDIPAWFSYPSVVKILRQQHPPKSHQGVCIFFTGLSGSGKTTVANALQERLMEMQDKKISILDGDHVRKMISKDLTFSREDRMLNVQRIGWIAGEICKHGGQVICAPIAPHEEARNLARYEVENYGGFCLVHLKTPVEVCEERDRKGLYKLARAGKITNFTGLDDPYESPKHAEVSINTGDTPVEKSVDMIVQWLRDNGYMENGELVADSALEAAST